MNRLYTPSWLKPVIGMKDYGVKITDAYIAKETNRPIFFDDIFEDVYVVALESDSLRRSTGYWYYHPNDEQWYWSNSTVKSVFRKAFDEIIKDNFNPEKSYD